MPAGYFEQGMAAMRRGDVGAAEALFKRALKKAPRDGRALLMLGNLAVGRGDPRAALDFLRKATAVDPANAAAWVNLGSTQRHLGRPDEAATCYRRALALVPGLAVAHSSLGSVLKETGRLDQAEHHCQEAVRLEPGNADGHLNLGAVRKERGDLAGAEACYREALRLNPELGQAHVNLGLVLQATARADEAIACFGRALELRGAARAARAQLGHAYLARDRYEDAAACYRIALQADPGDWQLRINYGIALAETGSPERLAAMARLKQDHVYANLDEPMALARTLAVGYPVPPEFERAPLDDFFARFDPGAVYAAAWWRERLDAFGPPARGADTMLRGCFAKVFSWSLPDAAALAAVAGFIGGRRLCSHGAGSGYWEYLLQTHHGVNVTAGDLFLHHRFIPMRREDFGQAAVDLGDVVMFAWIIEARNVVDAALNVLRRMAPGQRLILMGDRPDAAGAPRTCGTPALFAHLAEHFTLERSVDLVNFSCLHDGIDCYVRNG